MEKRTQVKRRHMLGTAMAGATGLMADAKTQECKSVVPLRHAAAALKWTPAYKMTTLPAGFQVTKLEDTNAISPRPTGRTKKSLSKEIFQSVRRVR
jgi:hypothetical protein